MNRILNVAMIVLLIASPVFARMEVKDDTVQDAQKIKRKKFLFSKVIDDMNTVGNPKHIPDNNKVILPYFRVTYALGGKYLNNVGGVTTSKTKVMSKLTGVDEATMQQITDQIYADLLNQLKAVGFEVIDVATLESNEKFQKIKRAYPVVKKDTAMFTPAGMPYPGTIDVKAYTLAQDVDALMLKADYTVNFVVLNRNEKKVSILKDKSDVAVSQGINVFGEISVITPKGFIIFQIQQPILSKKIFGDVENATTKMDKVGDGITMVAGILGGGKLGNRVSTNRVEVETTPEEYKVAAEDALVLANQTLAEYMASQIGEEEVAQKAEDE